MAKDAGRRAWNLLVVDDNLALLELIPRMLSNTEFAVITASGGREALTLISADSEHTIELVLTDIVMPGMDGSELAACLRSLRPGLPVAFMTGYAEQLREPGPCLIKPFTASGLIAFLRAAVASGPTRRSVLAAGA